MTFQAVLFGSGDIDFRYFDADSTTTSNSNGLSATVGITNGSGNGAPGNGQFLQTSFDTSSLTSRQVIHFTAPPPHTLTVQVFGPGRVVAPGISCPPDCTETFLGGADVTLSPDSVLPVIWFGDCSGVDTPCQVSMNSDHFVKAVFPVGDIPEDPHHRARVHINLKARERQGNLSLLGNVNSHRNRCEGSVQVELHRTGGRYLATTMTDQSGAFSFGEFGIRNPDSYMFVTAQVDRHPGCKPGTSEAMEVPSFQVP
jgi:hypothetical protein